MTLQQRIQAIKNEKRRNSISPERLGSVLEEMQLGSNNYVSQIKAFSHVFNDDIQIFKGMDSFQKSLGEISDYDGDVEDFINRIPLRFDDDNKPVEGEFGDSFGLRGQASFYDQNNEVEFSMFNTKLYTNFDFGTSFNIGDGFNGKVNGVKKLQDTNEFIVYGAFTEFNGYPANRIVVLGEDGSRDETFISPITNGEVYDVLDWSNGDGKNRTIIACGSFENIGNNKHSFLIKLSDFGHIDEAFDVFPNDEVLCLEKTTSYGNNSFVLGGKFIYIQGNGGGIESNIAIVVGNQLQGLQFTNFPTPTQDSYVSSIESITSDGTCVVIGGSFTFNEDISNIAFYTLKSPPTPMGGVGSSEVGGFTEYIRHIKAVRKQSNQYDLFISMGNEIYHIFVTSDFATNSYDIAKRKHFLFLLKKESSGAFARMFYNDIFSESANNKFIMAGDFDNVLITFDKIEILEDLSDLNNILVTNSLIEKSEGSNWFDGANEDLTVKGTIQCVSSFNINERRFGFIAGLISDYGEDQMKNFIRVNPLTFQSTMGAGGEPFIVQTDDEIFKLELIDGVLNLITQKNLNYLILDFTLHKMYGGKGSLTPYYEE